MCSHEESMLIGHPRCSYAELAVVAEKDETVVGHVHSAFSAGSTAGFQPLPREMDCTVSDVAGCSGGIAVKATGHGYLGVGGSWAPLFYGLCGTPLLKNYQLSSTTGPCRNY